MHIKLWNLRVKIITHTFGSLSLDMGIPTLEMGIQTGTRHAIWSRLACAPDEANLSQQMKLSQP